MGVEIYNELITNYIDNIDTIYYLCPKNACIPQVHPKCKLIYTETSSSVMETISNILTSEHIDVFIHSMAVSDYIVDYVSNTNLISEAITSNIAKESISNILNTIPSINEDKISSNHEDLIIKLKKGPKIINKIKELSPDTMLVGFKLLSNVSKEHLYNVAHDLLEKNSASYIVANDLSNITSEKHEAMIIDKTSIVAECITKKEIAKEISKVIF